VNVKKGQFLSPWDMKNVIAKITGEGNSHVLVTERGVSFGYNTLVSDMRALPIMAATGAPVIFDATHSVQQPGGQGTASGGDRRFVPVLARAAVAVGVAGVFVETHEDPDRAPSDGPNMLPISEMPGLIRELMALDAIAKARVSLAPDTAPPPDPAAKRRRGAYRFARTRRSASRRAG
jgi:2-dehydro-3-deoxyphosphooctonate aldolase (KDO 8-P synthase)